MTKHFCDVCGKGDVSTPPRCIEVFTLPDGSKITGSLLFSFKGRSDGFGGTPDLCWRCIRKSQKAIMKGSTA